MVIFSLWYNNKLLGITQASTPKESSQKLLGYDKQSTMWLKYLIGWWESKLHYLCEGGHQ